MSKQDLVYLDHAAATPMSDNVIEAMKPYFNDRFFNPSSPYAPAVEVRREYQEAKGRLATTFGGKADEIIITAGATESINLAFGVVSGHVVTSQIEHPAVLEAAKKRDHTLVEPLPNGTIRPEAVSGVLHPDTVLVSIQLTNNEIGTIQPLSDIAAIVRAEREKRALSGNTTPLFFHTDASQGFGMIDCHVARLGVDMMTLNAGKIYGPKQVGLLWRKASVHLEPLILGGGQELGLRSGTENVAGTIGFSIAAEQAVKHMHSENKRLTALRDRLQQDLLETFPDAVISGNQKKRLPGNLHISFSGLDAERLIFRLEAKGVLVATGSACAANKGTRSHVLTAIGMDASVADGSLRLTLGKLTDDKSIKKASKILRSEITDEHKRVKKI